jgi:hypothetical protein
LELQVQPYEGLVLHFRVELVGNSPGWIIVAAETDRVLLLPGTICPEIVVIQQMAKPAVI